VYQCITWFLAVIYGECCTPLTVSQPQPSSSGEHLQINVCKNLCRLRFPSLAWQIGTYKTGSLACRGGTLITRFCKSLQLCRKGFEESYLSFFHFTANYANFFVLCSTPLFYLKNLRYHSFGECWDWTKDCFRVRINTSSFVTQDYIKTKNNYRV
jgi:hypothetical protein